MVNCDVPNVPEDYIHRVGRTARAEMTGDAITFVAPDEEADLRAIERAIGKRLPRVTVPDFDYTHRPIEKLEVPIHERIAAIRARKSDDRARAKAKGERRAAAPAPPLTRRSAPPSPRFAGRGPSGVTSPSPRPRGEGGRRPDEGRPHRSRGRRRP